jgi:hypothetical protein
MFQALKSVWELFVKQLNDKNYKRLVLALMFVLSVVFYLSVDKLTKIDNKINLLAKNDSVIQDHIYNRMGKMYSDGIDLFIDYTASATTDLKTIVDFTVVSKSQADLLKKLLEKSLSENAKNAQKQQFKNRYIDTAKTGPIKWEPIQVRKVSFLPSFLADSLLFAQTLYGAR